MPFRSPYWFCMIHTSHSLQNKTLLTGRVTEMYKKQKYIKNNIPKYFQMNISTYEHNNTHLAN